MVDFQILFNKKSLKIPPPLTLIMYKKETLAGYL